jgi:hypothetical protein
VLAGVGPLRRSNFQRSCRWTASAAVGLPGFHVHDLRHTGNTSGRGGCRRQAQRPPYAGPAAGRPGPRHGWTTRTPRTGQDLARSRRRRHACPTDDDGCAADGVHVACSYLFVSVVAAGFAGDRQEHRLGPHRVHRAARPDRRHGREGSRAALSTAKAHPGGRRLLLAPRNAPPGRYPAGPPPLRERANAPTTGPLDERDDSRREP